MLKAGFLSLHGAPAAPADDETLALSDYAAAAAMNSTDLFIKTMRVKANKAYRWLATPGAPHQALLCVAISRVFEAVLFKFMSWQQSDAHLRHDVTPVSEMANPASSPALHAISQVCFLMDTGHINTENVSFMSLAESDLSESESEPICVFSASQCFAYQLFLRLT